MIDPIGLHGAQLKIFFSLYIEWKTIDRYKAEKSETKKKNIFIVNMNGTIFQTTTNSC